MRLVKSCRNFRRKTYVLKYYYVGNSKFESDGVALINSSGSINVYTEKINLITVSVTFVFGVLFIIFALLSIKSFKGFINEVKLKKATVSAKDSINITPVETVNSVVVNNTEKTPLDVNMQLDISEEEFAIFQYNNKYIVTVY